MSRRGISRFTAPLLFAGLAGVAGLACADRPAGDAAVDDAAAVPHELVIRARDFAYEAPDSVPSGPTTIRLVNEGPDYHHVSLLRLEDGKTLDDFKQALATSKPGSPPPDWLIDVGGPNTPEPDGGEFVASLDLEPGNYAMVCFIPDSTQTPHFVHGMVKGLTVVPSGENEAMPAADAVMTLYDYGFRMDQPLVAGPQQVRVVNEAEQVHEVFILKLNPGRTSEDFLQWMAAPAGPPPGSAVGGITGIAPGQENLMSLDLAPGNYALYCFVPDATDGKPHLMHGMATMITVT